MFVAWFSPLNANGLQICADWVFLHQTFLRRTALQISTIRSLDFSLCYAFGLYFFFFSSIVDELYRTNFSQSEERCVNPLSFDKNVCSICFPQKSHLLLELRLQNKFNLLIFKILLIYFCCYKKQFFLSYRL
jgi:hypothetical protein